MAKKKDLNTEVLIQIRDELRTTRTELSSRIDATNERVDALRTDLSGRIDETNDRLDRVERRQVESEVRLATELIAVAGTVRELRDTLLEDRRLRQQVDEHERRITELENAH